MIRVTNSINVYRKSPVPFKASESPIETKLQMPDADRNYCVFDRQKVDYYVSQGEKSLPYLKKVLETSNDEKEIVESLYILDRLADNKTKGIPAMYPVLARLNDTNSPNIQVYLAGIYRKTQVPDAFGPLVKMLIKDSASQTKGTFDPTEEIGGAILEYISVYSKGKPQIDFSA